MKNNLEQTKEASLIFLHLPKAAGTTFKDIIRKQYTSSEIYELSPARFQESQAEFKQLPKEQKQNIKLLMGHMNFGLHEHMPQPCSYITMFRNPIDRVVSYYYFVQLLKTHPHHDLVVSQNLSLSDYFQLQDDNMENGQTRFLTAATLEETRENGELILHQAKENLSKYFSFVGLTEEFDRSLILLKRKLNFSQLPYYFKLNTNNKKAYKKTELDEQTLDIIKQHNQLDLQLYEYVQEIFKRDIATEKSQGFERELAKFQFYNQLYGKFYSVARYIIDRKIK